MEKIKFIHFSDVHLDSPFSYLGLMNNKAKLRRSELKDVVRDIFYMAKKNEVDFVMITGDLFENKYVNKSTIIFLNEIFQKASPVKIFITPGNHDPFVNDSYYKSFNWSDNVYIFSKSFTKYSFDNKKVNIYGVGFEKFYEDNLIEIIKNDSIGINEDYINIMGLHGTIDIDLGKNSYNFMKESDLDELKMDYIGLGHFHKKFEKRGKKENIFNPGCPEPLKFNDSQECGVYLIDLEKDGENVTNLKTEFIKTNKRFFKRINVIINENYTDDTIIENIFKQLEETKNSIIGIYSFVLKGRKNKDHVIDMNYLNERLEDKYFYYKLADLTEEAYDLDKIKNEKGIYGIFVRKALEKIKNAKNDKEREVAKKSLQYGIEILEKGKLEFL
jgi:DNA repair exonuclease SbcCD nuclease subunit